MSYLLSLAEFERSLIRERTKAGFSAARARGRMAGKPKGLSNAAMSKAHAAKALYDRGRDRKGLGHQQGHRLPEVAAVFGYRTTKNFLDK